MFRRKLLFMLTFVLLLMIIRLRTSVIGDPPALRSLNYVGIHREWGKAVNM